MGQIDCMGYMGYMGCYMGYSGCRNDMDGVRYVISYRRYKVKAMKAILAVILLSGCAGLATYQPRNADEAIRMAKEVGGTGCYYGRVSGNSRPYADVEVRSIVVTTVGKGTTYLDCVQAIPPEMRSMLIPNQPQ